jgi:hypothetical protein
LSYDEAKGPRTVAAQPSTGVSERVDAALRQFRDELLRGAAARILATTVWARRQAEFNQIMRFVLAVPLVAGTATPVARDYHSLPTQTAALLKRQEPAPEPAKTVPIAPGSSSIASTTMTAPLAQVVEPIPGPRVRANCSRGTRTVFLDDRPAVEASEDWKEGLTQRYQGAVCSFVPRFGVPEPGFRTYEAPAETKSVEAIQANSASTDPIRVRTTIERETPGMDDGAPAPRSPDADGIEQALAVLGAPATGRTVGGKVTDDRAKAAIAALAAADDQDPVLPKPTPSKPALTSQAVAAVPTLPRRIAVRWSVNDLRHLPAYLSYRWTSDRVTTPFDLEIAMLEGDLYFPAQATPAWSKVFGQESTGGLLRMSVEVAEQTSTRWLRSAAVALLASPEAPTWPTPAIQKPDPDTARQVSAAPTSSSTQQSVSVDNRS